MNAEEIKDIIITEHAVKRFSERVPYRGFDMAKRDPKEMIRKMLQSSFPVEFNKEHRTKRLLHNNFEYSRYLYNDGLIFVLSDPRQPPPHRLITVEPQEDRVFGTDLFKIKEERK